MYADVNLNFHMARWFENLVLCGGDPKKEMRIRGVMRREENSAHGNGRSTAWAAYR
jgi:hypothetical protein